MKKAAFVITTMMTLIFVMNGCANVGPRMSPARNNYNQAPVHSVAPAVPRTNNSGTYNNSGTHNTPYNSGTYNSGTHNSGTSTVPNNNNNRTVPNNNTAPRSSANTTITR